MGFEQGYYLFPQVRFASAFAFQISGTFLGRQRHSGSEERFGAIGRFGRPEDVARAVRLFLEPDNYITGQTLVVDGGLTLRRDRG